MLFIIYFFLFALISCSDIYIKDNANNTKNNGESKRKLENEDYRDINILFDLREIIDHYDSIKYSLSDNIKEVDLLINFLKTFNTTLKKIIKIKKDNKNNIRVSDGALNILNTNGFNLSANLKNELFDYDLVIFVKVETSQNKFDDLNIVQYDEDDKRPIVGFIKYYTDFGFPITKEKHKIQMLNIFFLHQTTHILGFMYSILKINGLLKLTEKEIGRKKKSKKNVIVEEKTIEIAKKYFNCNTIEYIELDDNSVEGKELIHWEGRILLGDYMTSEIYYPEQVISEFTIAVLEGLGWYKINNFTGGLMKFGKNKGCNFLELDCAYSDDSINPKNRVLNSNFLNEFCNSDSFGTCSFGRQSRGYCYTSNNGKSEARNNGFIRDNWLTYGKNNVEFCPVSFETSNSKNNYYKGSCFIGNSDYGEELENIYEPYNDFSDIFEESIGNTSFCAYSSVLNKMKRDKSIANYYFKIIRPTCYSMSCSEKSLTIQINAEYIVCPREGGIIHIGGNDTDYTVYEGYLFCPDYNSICTGKFLCNNIIDCIEKKSGPKDSIYDYSDYNKTIFFDDVRTDNNEEGSIKSDDVVFGYELSENGKCPKDCIQCKENKQCILCRNLNDTYPYSFYVGTKENDEKPINCSKSQPERAYFIKKYNHIYYFNCIENCFECTDGIKCDKCLPTHKLNYSQIECIERIKHCIKYNESYNYTDNETNGGGIGYIECSQCDIDNKYFCVNMNKNICELVEDYNNITYYRMEDENNKYSCIQKCNDTYPHCLECVKNTCRICEPEYFVNNTGHCQERIPHCSKYNGSFIVKDNITNGGGNSYPLCENCNNEKYYFCINMTKNSCDFISLENQEYYYNEETRKYSCKKRCNETYPYCEKCNINNCSECIVNFTKNGSCYPTIDNCIDYNIHKNVSPDYADCKTCNETGNYYCINNNRAFCQEVINNDSYFRLDDDSYSCIQKCEEKFKDCIKCNKDKCIKCKENFILSNINNSICLPIIAPASDDSCKALINDYNKDINEIELEDFIDYFFTNSLKYPHHVHHFVGNNYTVTLFIHSQCTEDLLNQGYFKIDSSQLYEEVRNISKIETNEYLFSIFVTYNFQNYFTFFDVYTRHIEIIDNCTNCLDIHYTITNRYKNKISLVLGSAFANLVESEKLNIFSENSDIFSDFCQNVTIKRIDIPYSERMKLLYLKDYLTQIACTSNNCNLTEINTDESTSICQCPVGNKFEEIKSPILEFKNYQDSNSEDKISIIDTFGIIKCMKIGFNSKNIFANGGFFMTGIAIVAEVVFYIWYGICCKVINYGKQKVSNPPPKVKNRLFLINEWQQNNANKIIIEQGDDEQKLIQSRDEEEDGNVLEEDVTFSAKLNNSSFSIDTELAIFNNNDLKKKNKDKKGRKVLVLLPEKRNKNKHKIDDEKLKNMSENDYLTVEQAKMYDKRSFCQIYWAVLSIKQHIINFFSGINCCKITESYIPLPIKLIRSLFMIILALLVNILFLTQNYFLKKYKYFNQNYKILANKNDEFVVTPEEVNEDNIPTRKLISYAISNGFLYAVIDFAILLVIQFLLGIIFLRLRNKLLELVQIKDINKLDDLASKTRIKYIIFFILTLCLLVVFLLTFVGFGGAYGGGFIDYLIPGIIALLFLEIFPFLWSLIIALLRYTANKNGSKCPFEFSQFFMF